MIQTLGERWGKQEREGGGSGRVVAENMVLHSQKRHRTWAGVAWTREVGCTWMRGVHWEKRNISPTLSCEDDGTILAADSREMLRLEIP